MELVKRPGRALAPSGPAATSARVGWLLAGPDEDRRPARCAGIARTGTGSGRRVGRPRAAQRPDSGRGPRAELLAAAAELFTTRGYAAATTRAVAERAGMRQASMCHYVSGEEELPARLLESHGHPLAGLCP